MSSERKPTDGVAVLLHLIEAARAWYPAARERDRLLGPNLDPAERTLLFWVEKLEERYAREQPEPEPVGWEPRRWRELVTGDRVSVNGAEGEIAATSGPLEWHVDPRSNPRYPSPLEHTTVRVSIKGWSTYDFPADGEVEALRGPAGQAIDEANGYRSLLGEEPVNVLESWAEDAAATLRAAGLSPEVLS